VELFEVVSVKELSSHCARLPQPYWKTPPGSGMQGMFNWYAAPMKQRLLVPPGA
jgi:hypothetical protein